MTEKQFIKEFEDYFTEITLTDHGKRRLLTMLDRYTEGAKERLKKEHKKEMDKVMEDYHRMAKKASRSIAVVNTVSGVDNALPSEEMDEIAGMVADKYGITVYDLKGKSRESELVAARISFTKEYYKRAGALNLSHIGKYLNRDHSTIINYRRYITGEQKQLPKVKA